MSFQTRYRLFGATIYNSVYCVTTLEDQVFSHIDINKTFLFITLFLEFSGSASELGDCYKMMFKNLIWFNIFKVIAKKPCRNSETNCKHTLSPIRLGIVFFKGMKIINIHETRSRIWKNLNGNIFSSIRCKFEHDIKNVKPSNVKWDSNKVLKVMCDLSAKYLNNSW